jgi:hypothetical protein
VKTGLIILALLLIGVAVWGYAVEFYKLTVICIPVGVGILFVVSEE